MVSLAFISTSLIIIVIPGPGALYTISTGLKYGHLKSMIAVLGCTLSILPHLAFAIFGVTIIQRINPTFFIFIQILGALYLAYLGWQLIAKNEAISIVQTNLPQSNLSIFSKGIILNLLNPKLTMFFLSFLPQFLAKDSTNKISQMVLLGLIFMILTLVVFLVFGLLSSAFNHLINNHPKALTLVQRSIGLLFFLFTLNILWSLIK